MTEGRRPALVVAATIVAGLACAIAIVVANAPANWLAEYLARRTNGVVLLADARGTIWSGSAVLAIGSPIVATDVVVEAAGESAEARGMALPGRVTWRLEIEGALAPVLHLTHDGVLLQPLAVRYREGALLLDAGAVALPASLLRLAGAPLNTLLPEGRCTLRWNGLRFAGPGMPVGQGTLGIASFGLSVSPVRPLGDYLLSWSSGASGLAWRIGTERGPLDLQGGGSVAGRRSQVRIVARAARDAPAPVVLQLNPLLDMIGRRGTEEAVIESGGRS